MPQSHAAKLDALHEHLEQAIKITTELRQEEEDEYLQRTDHICKCKGCENHEE